MNDRFWRKAAIGLAGVEWPLLTQSGHSTAHQISRELGLEGTADRELFIRNWRYLCPPPGSDRSCLLKIMASFKRAPSKEPLLDPTESAALRDIAAAKPHTLARLEKLGLVEQKAGIWIPTQQGQIELMFGSAR